VEISKNNDQKNNQSDSIFIYFFRKSENALPLVFLKIQRNKKKHIYPTNLNSSRFLINKFKKRSFRAQPL